MPQLTSLDHLVLTVRDVSRTCAFYRDVLGMEVVTFRPADGSERSALAFGQQKINLHQAGAEFEPKAEAPRPGSADLCFLSETPVEEWVAHFEGCGVEVIEGPVQRTGATGPILSVYIRDPDGNLIEVSNPQA
ncbi:virulence protein [Roseovarius sp. HI0049]|nr:virulence protein [Roseovarius sp. HI0049]